MDIFVKAVEHGSLAEAARLCGVSAGMAGKHLRTLEERLGSRLLERTTRRLTLTESGRRYYERSRRVLTDIAEADREASDEQITPRGLIRLNAPIAFGELHLARAVTDYNALNPEIQIEITLNNYFVDFMDGNCDLAIRIGTLDDSNFVARKITSSSRILCASPDYLKRNGVPQHPSDLIKHNCLVHLPDSGGASWRINRPNEAESVSVSGRVQCNSGILLREVALAGGGIARLPSFIVGDDIISGRLVPVLNNAMREELGIYAVYLSSRQLSTKIRSLVNFLVKRFGPNPAWDKWAQ